jgi:tRNA A-37 threonylcarbamoyl transferase component Bud32
VTPPHDPTMSHSSLDAAIAGYMQAVESGQVPNRQALLDQHPEIADQLHAFFADFDRMDRIASPLRNAVGLDATSDAASGATSALPTIRYFGDYELLEEIARGGMGIVYKARQSSLNRIVALKMILRGTFASPRDVQRFRAEAESAAILDHPHIVPIHEVGDHDGQQYFSMKFVEGTSLATHPKADARAEVTRFLEVVRAVHYAHQHGVLHRDLKPSNVLVDSNGTRFVTDFGLAKRLTDTAGDHSLTEPGQVLGTPKYMSPEQAAGRKDLTVAADVYSLGVILYERLTGQTPFTGENALTLLRQVRETEPPRPSAIKPGLDRDLETVALKCLDKEPARRYSSAEPLAEDLKNWLAGRPISARPVSQTERAWRWCKRNPAVAVLAASVALSLILGAVISGFFAVAERRGRIRAEAAEDRTERTFAQSLVRPLDPSGDEQSHEALSEAEIAALWELSRLQSEPVGLRFLDEATSDPLMARQLRSRSEPALIAAIGLDPGRRERASALLQGKVRDPKLQLANRVESALVELELGDRPSPVTEEATNLIVQSFSGKAPEFPRTSWLRHLVDASDRIDHTVANGLLAVLLEKETDWNARTEIASTIVASAARTDPTARAHFLGAVLEKEADSNLMSNQPFTGMMMVNGMAPTPVTVLASALETAARQAEPVEASKICSRAAQAMVSALQRKKDPSDLCALAAGLAALRARLEKAEASRLCAIAAHTLITSVLLETGKSDATAVSHFLTQAPSTLSSLSDRVEPIEASRIYAKLSHGLATMLANTAKAEDSSARLADAAKVCGPVVDDMAAALMAKTSYFGYLWDGFAIVATRVSPADAARAAHVLADALNSATDANVRRDLLSSLSKLAGRLAPTDAAQICGPSVRMLEDALTRESSAGVGDQLASELVALAGLMEPAEASRICRDSARAIADALARETNAGDRIQWARTLVTLASRVDPAEAARIRRLAATVFADARKQETPALAINIANGLSSLATSMDPSEASAMFASAVDYETNPNSPGWKSLRSTLNELNGMAGTQPGLIDGLVTAVSRLSTAEAARVCGQTASLLSSRLEREPNTALRNELALSLAKVAGKMDPVDASRVCDKAIDILVQARAEQPQEHASIDPLVAKLLLRIDPQIASRRARDLSTVMMRDWNGSAIMGMPMMGMMGRGLSGSDAEAALLNSVLTDNSREQISQRIARIAKTAVPGFEGVLEAAARLFAEPFPCRLTTQELVELLKMPTCIGAARRVVLDHLGNRYGRRFVNHWAFVRHATEQKLDLDLTTPPRRPELIR